MVEDIFVLLDDCNASTAKPTSRLYTGFVREHICTQVALLPACWEAVELDLQQGLHAALFIDYEWGARLVGAGTQHLGDQDNSALRVLMFRSLAHLSEPEVTAWLHSKDSTPAACAGIANLQASVSQDTFERHIACIQAWIAQGQTYQINYTYRLEGAQYGPPVALYLRLRQTQAVPFGVLAKLPSPLETGPVDQPECVQWVLSRSPELFIQHHRGVVTARPMKGTAPRFAQPQADNAQAQWLARDAKNRSENVMIVDLLRNDLAQIAQLGSVKVPHLFSIETYQTVHQMTSTVTADMQAGVRFPHVLRALFPCGSITGAPKLHTMNLIADLETAPRGLYCGAIGWFDAPTLDHRCGNFCLSVAIRTLTLGEENNGLRKALTGLGGGIVIDSVAGDEFEETRTKARYITQTDPGFTLFETMRVERGRVKNQSLHWLRMQASAQALGFMWDAHAANQALAQLVQTLDMHGLYRVRMDLAHRGAVTLTHATLAPLPQGPVALIMAKEPVPLPERGLLNHKTSMRSHYDAAIQSAIQHGAFDTLYTNARGELSEGARSTVLVKLEGRWWTPPLHSGALAGVMRTRLLARSRFLTERVLWPSDLHRAQGLAVCSALRGVLSARLQTPMP